MYDVILSKMRLMVGILTLLRLLQIPMSLRMNLGKFFFFFPGARKGRAAEHSDEIFLREHRQKLMNKKRVGRRQLPFKLHKGWCCSDAD
jgi:hypothetical protein